VPRELERREDGQRGATASVLPVPGHPVSGTARRATASVLAAGMHPPRRARRPLRWHHPTTTCSVKGGDGLHLSVKVVNEHLARRVLTGDTSGVLNRVAELVVAVEFLATAPARPGAVFLFDDSKEVRAHAPILRRGQPSN
jgi:hypothetical protein